jgi:hypothetical protein
MWVFPKRRKAAPSGDERLRVQDTLELTFLPDNRVSCCAAEAPTPSA